MSGRAPGSVPLSAVAGAVAVTLLVVLLATWAATSGGDPVFRGEGHRLPSPSATTESPSSAAPDEGPELFRDDLPSGPEERPLWVTALALLVQVGAVVVVAVLLLRLLRAARRRWAARLLPPGRHHDPDFDVLDPPVQARAARAIAADSQAQLAVLEEGTARNGIVECWHRFELQAAEAGVVRAPWETSSEFALRLLDLAEADPRAVADLAALYREARFSDHDLEEPARARARSALTAIHSLGHP